MENSSLGGLDMDEPRSDGHDQSAPDWTVISNGRRVRLIVKRVPALPWLELQRAEWSSLDLPLPGRDVTPHDAADDAVDIPHMRSVGAWIEGKARQGRFRKLLLVAAPHVLRHLYAALGETTRERLLATHAIDALDLRHWGMEHVVDHLPYHRPLRVPCPELCDV